MKKSLLMLPFLAISGLAIAGCETKVNLDDLDDYKLGQESFEGHKRVTTLKDGKSYYFGFFRQENEDMRFVNGEPHKDKGVTYPYYLATTEDTLEGAAKIKIHFTKDNKFTMKIDCPGSTYDGNYISVYHAISKYNKNVMSINATSDELDAPYYDEDKDEEFECFYEFEWCTEYDDYGILCPMLDDDDAYFFGAGYNSDEGEYISMDCSNADECLTDEYNLAHFYEA